MTTIDTTKFLTPVEPPQKVVRKKKPPEEILQEKTLKTITKKMMEERAKTTQPSKAIRKGFRPIVAEENSEKTTTTVNSPKSCPAKGSKNCWNLPLKQEKGTEKNSFNTEDFFFSEPAIPEESLTRTTSNLDIPPPSVLRRSPTIEEMVTVTPSNTELSSADDFSIQMEPTTNEPALIHFEIGSMVSSSSPSHRKSVDKNNDTSTDEVNERLLKLMDELNETSQEAFTDALREQLSKVSAFQTIVSSANKAYQKAITKKAKNDILKKDTEERATYHSLLDNFKKCKHIFDRRMDVLSEQIKRNNLEGTLLVEGITGNSGYSKVGFNGFNCYGVIHRLNEFTNLLTKHSYKEEENLSPLLKKESENIEDYINRVLESLGKESAENSIFSQYQDLCDATQRVDVLKERVIVFNNSALKDSSKSKSTNLSNQFYEIFNSEYHQCSDEMNVLKSKYEEELTKIQKSLKEDTHLLTADNIKVLKQQVIEIESRLNAIETTINEIRAALVGTFGHKKLDTSSVKKDGPIHPKEFPLPDVSKELTLMFQLLDSTVTAAKGARLKQTWSKEVYSQNVKHLAALQTVKILLEDEMFRNKIKEINATNALFKDYITGMNDKKSLINANFSLLKNNFDERTGWKQMSPIREEPKHQRTQSRETSIGLKQEESTNPQAKWSSFGLTGYLNSFPGFNYFSSATQPSKPPLQPTLSTSMTPTSAIQEEVPIQQTQAPSLPESSTTDSIGQKPIVTFVTTSGVNVESNREASSKKGANFASSSV